MQNSLILCFQYRSFKSILMPLWFIFSLVAHTCLPHAFQLNGCGHFGQLNCGQIDSISSHNLREFNTNYGIKAIKSNPIHTTTKCELVEKKNWITNLNCSHSRLWTGSLNTHHHHSHSLFGTQAPYYHIQCCMFLYNEKSHFKKVPSDLNISLDEIEKI